MGDEHYYIENFFQVMNRSKLENEENHILYKEKMNIHQFNVTNQNLEQTLHIQFTFDMETTKRKFPLGLYLRLVVWSSRLAYINRLNIGWCQCSLAMFRQA